MHWLDPIIEGKVRTYEDAEWRFQIVCSFGKIRVRDANAYENNGWVMYNFDSLANAKSYCEQSLCQ